MEMYILFILLEYILHTIEKVCWGHKNLRFFGKNKSFCKINKIGKFMLQSSQTGDLMWYMEGEK